MVISCFRKNPFSILLSFCYVLVPFLFHVCENSYTSFLWSTLVVESVHRCLLANSGSFQPLLFKCFGTTFFFLLQFSEDSNLRFPSLSHSSRWHCSLFKLIFLNCSYCRISLQLPDSFHFYSTIDIFQWFFYFCYFILKF